MLGLSGRISAKLKTPQCASARNRKANNKQAIQNGQRRQDEDESRPQDQNSTHDQSGAKPMGEVGGRTPLFGTNLADQLVSKSTELPGPHLVPAVAAMSRNLD